jgi:acetyl-CoA carboxylase carboxyl transferase subunit alpha
MARLRTPVIAIVIGEGGSGGALGLGVANRVYMLENAYYSVISPESCAAIIYRDSGKAPEAAAALRMTAADLLKMGLIDGIVAEPEGGAHLDPDVAIAEVGRTLRGVLEELSGLSGEQCIDERYEKFRKMGNFFNEAAL